ncbi:MAG: hypothetical protein HYS22_03045 [Deltaproteobacteria bacterium]|nr:hypothetical protein [Deltaproteobacteria bacterium]
MKKNLPLIFLVCLVVIAGGATQGCVQRVPSPKRAQKMVHQFFTRYGHKYKESDFGQFKISKVEVGDIHEIQKGIAEIEAFVILNKGERVHKVNLLARKKTIGWKVKSWEDLGGS